MKCYRYVCQAPDCGHRFEVEAEDEPPEWRACRLCGKAAKREGDDDENVATESIHGERNFGVVG